MKRLYVAVTGIAVFSQLLSPTPSAAQEVDLGPARLRFDLPKYETPGCAELSLEAPGYDTDDLDVVTVEVGSRSDKEKVDLAEDGLGGFSGPCLPIAEGTAAAGDGTLTVEPGEIILASIYDEDDKTPQRTTLDVATIAGGEPQGFWNAEIDPEILPEVHTSGSPEPGEPPIAAVQDPSGTVALFGENHVVVQAGDPADLQSFLDRRGGVVRGTVSIPVEDAPTVPGIPSENTYYMVEVDLPADDSSDTEFFMETLGAEGEYTYSSEAALDLIGMALEEQLGGTFVLPSALLQPQGIPVGAEASHGDSFTHSWYDQAQSQLGIGGRESQGVLGALDVNRTVPTAIIDGGFASPADYSAGMYGQALDNPDYGMSFSSVPQCSFDFFSNATCGPGSAGGPNPLQCQGGNGCPWHGLQMYSTAGAAFANGFGTAGIGGQVVTPRFYKVGLPYIGPVASSIARATTDGAKVINISSGYPCKAFVFDICTTGGAIGAIVTAAAICAAIAYINPPLGAVVCVGAAGLAAYISQVPREVGMMNDALAFAEANNVVVAAGAGNSPVDPSEVRWIPCVLDHVLCVGAMGWREPNRISKSGFSAFGSVVDVYAPGENVASTPSPNTPRTGMPGQLYPLDATGGTSSASAFISGTAAVIRAVNPNLTAAQVRRVIVDSSCSSRSRPPRIGEPCGAIADADMSPAGYVDVLESLRRARQMSGRSTLSPCTGGWDEAPLPGQTTDRSNDNVERATRVGPLVFHGSERTINGDLSVHSLTGAGPADEDWYRLPNPYPNSSARMTVRLDMPETSSGTLAVELHNRYAPPTAGADPGPLSMVDRRITTNGSVSFAGVFFGEREYYIRVRPWNDAARNDACYSSLTVRLIGEGPPHDRFERDGREGPDVPNQIEGWRHTHFDSNARQSTERWALSIQDLSLHNVYDVDYFRSDIPDPQSSPDGHAGLLECGSTAEVNTISTTGAFSVRAVPEGDTPGERVVIRGATGDGTFPALTDTSTASNMRSVPCPRSSGHRRLVYSYGEQDVNDFHQVGVAYRLDVEYKINRIVRPPQWLEDERALARGSVMALPCAGGFVPGCGGSFPASHPFDPSRVPGCLADGCGDWIPISLETSGPLDIAFLDSAGLTYQLFDESRNVVAQAFEEEPSIPFFASAAEEDEEETESRSIMSLESIDAGLYVLHVTGPATDYTIDVGTVPTKQRILGLESPVEDAKKNQHVKLTGALDSGNPSCVAGQKVTLQEVKSKGKAHTVAETNTGADGGYSFDVNVHKGGEYQAVTSATSSCDAAESPPTTILVDKGKDKGKD